MNCRCFEQQLLEYLDGTLSAGRQAAAEKHLAGCAKCRGEVRRHRQFEQRLGGEFAQITQGLRLRPEVEQSVLRAGAKPPVVTAGWRDLRERFCNVRVWPWAAAACTLMAVVFLTSHFAGRHGPEAGTTRALEPSLTEAAFIQISYPVPTYRFQREGQLVRDTLTDETLVVNGKLFEAGNK